MAVSLPLAAKRSSTPPPGSATPGSLRAEAERKEVSLLWERLTQKTRECDVWEKECDNHQKENARLQQELKLLTARLGSETCRLERANDKCTQLRRDLGAAIGLSLSPSPSKQRGRGRTPSPHSRSKPRLPQFGRSESEHSNKEPAGTNTIGSADQLDMVQTLESELSTVHAELACLRNELAESQAAHTTDIETNVDVVAKMELELESLQQAHGKRKRQLQKFQQASLSQRRQARKATVQVLATRRKLAAEAAQIEAEREDLATWREELFTWYQGKQHAGKSPSASSAGGASLQLPDELACDDAPPTPPPLTPRACQQNGADSQEVALSLTLIDPTLLPNCTKDSRRIARGKSDSFRLGSLFKRLNSK